MSCSFFSHVALEVQSYHGRNHNLLHQNNLIIRKSMIFTIEKKIRWINLHQVRYYHTTVAEFRLIWKQSNIWSFDPNEILLLFHFRLFHINSPEKCEKLSWLRPQEVKKNLKFFQKKRNFDNEGGQVRSNLKIKILKPKQKAPPKATKSSKKKQI